MSGAISIYLEALRAAAAFAVFFHHISFQGFTGGVFWQLGLFGDDAVIAFFVLSGFVIAFSAENKHPSLLEYFIARLGRLWSVAIPAILLTIILDTIVRLYFDQNVSFNHRPDLSIRSVLTSIFFVNQVWFLKDVPGVNPPFWSISYEFFYYVFFAFTFYFRGWRRLTLATLTLLIAGPKISLFLPIWLLGVLSYRLAKLTFKQYIGWIAWSASILALLFYYGLDVKSTINTLLPLADFGGNGVWTTREVAARCLFALIVFINIFGFCIVGSSFNKVFRYAEPLIKEVARYSFSLYLYHFPLLMFFRSFISLWGSPLSEPANKWLYVALMYSGTLACTYVLGRLTEPRKKEISSWLRGWFSRSIKNTAMQFK